MDGLIPRHRLRFAREALGAFPDIVIQGARQVGKSTFAGILVGGRDAVSVTLDDADMPAAAVADPKTFVAQHPDGILVIDEVQRAPELLLSLKVAVDRDRDRRPGRFVLTGSSDLLRLARTPDSLAGRAVTVTLGTLSQGEIGGRTDDFAAAVRRGIAAGTVRSSVERRDYMARIARRGYPEVRNLWPRLRATWFDSYVERLLRCDIGDIAPRVRSVRVSAVLRLLAANQSRQLVKSRIARDAGIPESSVTAYLDLLQTVYLTASLRPWTPNLTSRESSRPKVCLAGPGIALRVPRFARLRTTSTAPSWNLADSRQRRYIRNCKEPPNLARRGAPGYRRPVLRASRRRKVRVR